MKYSDCLVDDGAFEVEGVVFGFLVEDKESVTRRL